ncbi:MAG: glycoside hydrolase family 127 protein [Acidobacteria bacterium]|nr:glycoside hydrolase family 127 protein [Acidobacteriota bacterium]
MNSIPRTLFHLAAICVFQILLVACQKGNSPAPPETEVRGVLGSDVRLVEPSFKQVKIADRFWSPRIETNHQQSLKAVLAKIEESGAIQNFAIAAGRAKGEFRGPFWADSDVYKWLEGASYTLALTPDPALEKRMDEVIELIAAAQQKDGYLDTYIQLFDPQSKWTNLAFFHEDFCAGHLFEAAVGHFESTGKRTLLDVAIKNADNFDSVFGPGKREGIPGHEGIELALVRLSRATGEKRYLKLAQFFIDGRGQKPSFFEREYQRLDPTKTVMFLGRRINYRTLADEFYRKDPNKFDTSYSQDHLPVRQQSDVVGHAVRAMYLFSGMADVAYESGDKGLLEALDRLHHNVTTKRMYVTGGIGPSGENEGFTTDYDLPNEQAYQETCASIGMMMWNHRLFKMSGDGRYADFVEHLLYNAVLAGVSFGGDQFCYVNPLSSSGKAKRHSWFSVPCCPTNVVRILPSLGKYIYSQSDDGVWVNLYIPGSMTAKLKNGSEVHLSQSGNYPWDGNIQLKAGLAAPQEFNLNLRIPGWATGATVKVNGQTVQPTVVKGYARINRQWANNDTIDLVLPMNIQRLEANPKVAEDRGKVALSRGPLIYCLEEPDQKVDLDLIVLPMNANLESHSEPGLLNGVTVITGQGYQAASRGWENRLYRPANSTEREPVTFKAIPYYSWGNRQYGKLAVWIQSSQ